MARTERGGDPDIGRIMGLLVVALVVGGPVAGYVWHELSEALLGRPHWVPLFIAIILLGALLGALYLLARRVSRLGDS